MARAHGLRLLTCDRPGVGQSSPRPDRSLLDWPADVRAWLEQLGIERFSVFGLSGGGPHVAVVAWAMPERIERAAIISGAGPGDRPDRGRDLWAPVRMLYFSAERSRWLLRAMLRAQRRALAKPERMAERIPCAELVEADPGGHLSTIHDHIDEIFTYLRPV